MHTMYVCILMYKKLTLINARISSFRLMYQPSRKSDNSNVKHLKNEVIHVHVHVMASDLRKKSNKEIDEKC